MKSANKKKRHLCETMPLIEQTKPAETGDKKNSNDYSLDGSSEIATSFKRRAADDQYSPADTEESLLLGEASAVDSSELTAEVGNKGKHTPKHQAIRESEGDILPRLHETSLQDVASGSDSSEFSQAIDKGRHLKKGSRELASERKGKKKPKKPDSSSRVHAESPLLGETTGSDSSGLSVPPVDKARSSPKVSPARVSGKPANRSKARVTSKSSTKLHADKSDIDEGSISDSSTASTPLIDKRKATGKVSPAFSGKAAKKPKANAKSHLSARLHVDKSDLDKGSVSDSRRASTPLIDKGKATGKVSPAFGRTAKKPKANVKSHSSAKVHADNLDGGSVSDSSSSSTALSEKGKGTRKVNPARTTAKTTSKPKTKSASNSHRKTHTEKLLQDETSCSDSSEVSAGQIDIERNTSKPECDHATVSTNKENISTDKPAVTSLPENSSSDKSIVLDSCELNTAIDVKTNACSKTVETLIVTKDETISTNQVQEQSLSTYDLKADIKISRLSSKTEINQKVIENNFSLAGPNSNVADIFAKAFQIKPQISTRPRRHSISDQPNLEDSTISRSISHEFIAQGDDDLTPLANRWDSRIHSRKTIEKSKKHGKDKKLFGDFFSRKGKGKKKQEKMTSPVENIPSPTSPIMEESIFSDDGDSSMNSNTEAKGGSEGGNEGGDSLTPAADQNQDSLKHQPSDKDSVDKEKTPLKSSPDVKEKPERPSSERRRSSNQLSPTSTSPAKGYDQTGKRLSVIDLKSAFNEKVEKENAGSSFMKRKSRSEKLDKENGLTPLMLACRDNKFGIVEKLLELGNPINELDKEGKSALYHAASSGTDNIVKALLNAKADPSITAGDLERSCLHQACARSSGAVEIVKALLRATGKEAKLIPDNGGHIPLHIAATTRNSILVKELLQSHVEEQIKSVNKEYRDTPLHVAARCKDTDIIRILVEHGANVEERNNEGQTILHIACSVSDESTVKYLHSVKANPNIHDKLNRTPLHVSTEGGHSNIIEILIDKFKADVNQRSKDGSTLIHLASKCGHPEVALFFVKRGVPLQMPNREGAICLHEAAKQGHVSVVKSLLMKGASVNVMTKDNYTPLHTAVRHGKHLVVQVVLGFGADVNCRGGKNKETPLHLAARLKKDAKHVSEMLLKSGANVNSATEQGVTPLQIAIEHENYDLVKILLDENADALWKSKNGEISLHVAVRNSNVAIALALMDHIKSNCSKTMAIHAVNGRNEDGDTCLHYVSKLKPEGNNNVSLDLAKLLIDNHADTSIVNFQAKESALHYCSRSGNLELLKLLVRTMKQEAANKAVNHQNKSGWSPLLIAAKEGHEEIMKVLIDYNARIDIFDEAGKTALHVSSENGHIQVVELLMSKKAYVNAKTKIGLTAVHLAAASGLTNIVEMLVKKYKASLDVMAINKQTSLHLAALNGQIEVAGKLLELKADPNSTDANGYTPLHVAAEENHPEVIRLFINHTPSLIFQVNKEGNTCAHIAAAKGSLKVMKALVQCDKTTVNTRNKRTYETPMHLSASGGHYDLMQYLMEMGASLEDEDKEGMTPLHLCAKYGHRNMIESLKGKVPLAMSSAKNGLTAIHVAAEYGKADVLQDLLQKIPGGTPSECPRGKENIEGLECGFTPLHLAARNGHEAIVRLLLNSHGVRVDTATQGKGLIPLHFGLMNGHTTVVSLLLGRSTHQLSIKCNQGRTGLHFAAAYGHLELVTLLLGQGAEINVVDNDYWSALHYAADAGHVEVVKYLVRMGAETTIEDKNNKTPLAFAAKNHHLAVMKYLVMRNFNVENMLTDRKFLSNLMLCSKLNENGSMIDFILNSPAPIYTSCKLARLYRIESTREKDKSNDFIAMGTYCEEVSYDLLHLATTFDTEHVLNAIDDARQPLLDIMIDGELKICVAHTNVQGYLGEVWKGESSLFEGWRSVLLFMMCMFIPPLWAFLSLPFHRYSRVPTLKFICYVISHFYLCFLLILVVVVPWNRSTAVLFPTPYEWLLLIWLSGMLLSQIAEPQNRSGLGLLPPIVLGLSTIAITIHLCAFLAEGQTREQVMYARDQVFGFVLLICVAQCMEFLSLHHLFGPWSIIIRSLFQDLLRFLVILLIFIVGFALQLMVVYKPVYSLEKKDIPTSTVPIPGRESALVVFEHLFFAMFGLTGKSDITAYDSSKNPAATKYLALVIFGAYEIIIIVVLINLLIAMMSNTYTRLEERSDIEWKFGRAKMIRNMTKTVSTPVPLNIITTVMTIMKVIFKTNCCCCRTDIHKVCDEMEHKLPDMQLESFVSADRSNAVEEGSSIKRIVDVVNWSDIVSRYLQNKGLQIEDDEDEIDRLEHGTVSRNKKRTQTMRAKETAQNDPEA